MVVVNDWEERKLVELGTWWSEGVSKELRGRNRGTRFIRYSHTLCDLVALAGAPLRSWLDIYLLQCTHADTLDVTRGDEDSEEEEEEEDNVEADMQLVKLTGAIAKKIDRIHNRWLRLTRPTSLTVRKRLADGSDGSDARDGSFCRSHPLVDVLNRAQPYTDQSLEL